MKAMQELFTRSRTVDPESRGIASSMWGYQSQFRLEAHNAARTLFNLCDPLLQPVVFLVGIPVSTTEAPERPICIEPEVNLLYRDQTLGPEHLAGVMSEPRRAPDSHGRTVEVEPVVLAGGLNPGPSVGAFAAGNDRIESAWRQRASLGEVVARCLNRAVCYHDTIHFAAPAIRVNGHEVVVVLRLSQSAYKSHYALRSGSGGNTPAVRELGTATSLLNATIAAFLRDQTLRLAQPEPGKSTAANARAWTGDATGEDRGGGGRPAEELLREAGRSLTLTAGLAGAGGSERHVADTSGHWGLFDACNAISAMRYEGAEAEGRMLICRSRHPGVDMKLALRAPVGLTDHRTVRKLLEVSRHDAQLVSDATRVTGLGNVARYDGSSEDIFEIRFAKHYCWDLYHNQQHMMRVSYGCPQLPRADDVSARFREIITRTFPGNSTLNTDRLWRLVDAVRQTGQGSTIVIAENAGAEASRLAAQSLEVDPVDGSFGLVRMISAVDGAIMMDPQGRVHAFGVILDGVASPEGDRARGSRYNSAVRYQQSCTSRCVVVVMSDDGMIDVLPKLRPQIGHWEPETWVRKLETLASGATPEFSIYSAVMEWLVEHAFYLTEKQCHRANAAKAKVATKFQRQRGIHDSNTTNSDSAVNGTPQYPDFHPDPKLNETFFVES